jgi:hypothetical protein
MMTPDFLSVTLVVTSIVAALSVVFLGGWLIRNDRNRAATGLSACVIEDLRWVQDLVVDFFAQTRPCTQLLCYDLCENECGAAAGKGMVRAIPTGLLFGRSLGFSENSLRVRRDYRVAAKGTANSNQEALAKTCRSITQPSWS